MEYKEHADDITERAGVILWVPYTHYYEINVVMYSQVIHYVLHFFTFRVGMIPNVLLYTKFVTCLLQTNSTCTSLFNIDIINCSYTYLLMDESRSSRDSQNLVATVDALIFRGPNDSSKPDLRFSLTCKERNISEMIWESEKDVLRGV